MRHRNAATPLGRRRGHTGKLVDERIEVIERRSQPQEQHLNSLVNLGRSLESGLWSADATYA